VRGSTGAAYGSGAQGGVVRLRFPRAVPPLALDVTGGSFGYLQAVGCAGLGRKAMNLMLSGHFERADGDYPYVDLNGRHRIRQNNHHWRSSGAIRGRVKLGHSGQISTLIDFMRDQRGEPGSTQAPSEYARSEQERLTANITWRDTHMLGGALSAHGSLSAVRRVYKFDEPRPSFGLDGQAFRMDDNTIRFRTGSAIENLSTLRPSITFEGAMETADTLIEDKPRLERRFSGAITAQLIASMTPTLEIDFTGRMDARSGRDAMWVPKLGAAWHPAGGLTIRANTGLIFRDPSFDELFFKGTGISGNPNLRPESGWNSDVGIQYRRQGAIGLKLSATGYLQVYDRLILFLPLDAFRIQASDTLSSRVVGAELRLRVGHQGSWVEANYHLQSARDETDRRIPFRPTQHLTTRLGWRWGPITAYGGLYMQDAVTSDRFGHREIPGYARTDAGLKSHLPYGLQVGLEVQNMLDTKQTYDAIHRPLPGRTVYGMVSWREASP
jgi:outer membrane receptor protein involved in Fe transport